MGWGAGRFPVISHLNMLTSSLDRRKRLVDFLTASYGTLATFKTNYALGEICLRWKDASSGHEPPWENDDDNPHRPVHARQWKKHCQGDLKGVTNPVTKNPIIDDLQGWIVAAITTNPAQQIIYKFKDADKWKATLTTSADADGRTVQTIDVEGPGF